MTAPAPSPAEQAVIDRFGIFEPEARVVAAVTEALLITILGTDDGDFLTGYDLPADEIARLIVEHGAAAAVAAYRSAQDGGAEEAVRRVEALAAEYERTPPGTVTRDRDVALDLRAALATQAEQ